MKGRHRGKGSFCARKGATRPPGKIVKAAPPAHPASVGLWAIEEDAALSAAVSVHGTHNWKPVAALVPGRSHKQCRERWEHSQTEKLGAWGATEDAALVRAASYFGAHKWRLISNLVPNRNPKQCRERWIEHLKPGIDKRQFTDEEDALLVEAVADHGTRWSAISEAVFEGRRTDAQLKNRWASFERVSRAVTTRGVGKVAARKPRLATKKTEEPKLPKPPEPPEPPKPPEPHEFDSLLSDLPEPRAPWPPLPAHVHKDLSLLPPPAKTSRAWMTAVRGSPTGITVNFNHYISYNKRGPFDAVNRALAGRVDARAFAFDGLPRQFAPFNI
jgi:hypothetical protein